MKKTLWAFVAGTSLLLAGLPVAYLTWPAPTPGVSGDAQVGGPFELLDPQGKRVDERSHAGRWTLVFFGFTHCPDACPTALATIASVMDRLGAQAQQLQPLFITLDPQRDTPEVLGQYTAYFDSRILGLTGSTEQIRQVSEAYAVYSKKIGSGDSYTLDHTTTLYLMRPDGALARTFSRESAEDMARQIGEQLDGV